MFFFTREWGEKEGREKGKGAGRGVLFINSVYLRRPVALLVLIAVTSESSYSAIGQFCIIYDGNESLGMQQQQQRLPMPVCITDTWVNSRLSAARGERMEKNKKRRAKCFIHKLAYLRRAFRRRLAEHRETLFDAAGPHLRVLLSMKAPRLQCNLCNVDLKKSGQSERTAT